MTLCIRLETPFTTLLVISTVFAIPTWLRYALVITFLLSIMDITINPSSSSIRQPHRSTPMIRPARSYSAVTETPHSLTDLARYWLAVLFSALSPAVYPAHSDSDDDLLRHRQPRVIGLGYKRHRHLTKTSVRRRGSRALPPKIPKTPKTPKTSDEHGHAADNPDLRYPINNPPCSHPSHDRSNDESQTLVTAIDRQTEVLHRVLSAVTSSQTPTEPGPLAISLPAFMPRPGQPGSLNIFAGNDISNYLDDYNAECDLYAVKPDHRTILLPRYYCNPNVKDIVKLLPGYESHNWTTLQAEIKRFYWQLDHPKNTLTYLNALIRSSADLPLSAYILKFTSITNVLVADKVLFPVNRIVKLLEGLDGKMRRKVIKFCVQNGWKVSDEDNGETPDFDEIKKFLEHEALTIDRISVYEREHCLHATSNPDSISAFSDSSDTLVAPSPKPAISANPAATPKPSPLVITASAPSPASAPAPVLAPASSPATAPAAASTATIPTIPTFISRRVPRVSRCIWCDSPHHSRHSECSLFIQAMKTGNIRINEVGYVVLSSTGAEFPPAFGRGGMKLLYDTVCPPPVPSHGLLRMYAYHDRIST
jgi:hypothetical protein